MRSINEVIVHCSATRPDWMIDYSLQRKIDEIRRWHVSGNGWSDIGYHDLIDRDGTVLPGRPIGRAGAHTKGRNQNSIGVCLIGGHGSAETDAPEEHFTEPQLRALANYLDTRKAQFPITRISGHNQYAAKACPGFNVPAWYAAVLNSEPPAAPSEPAKVHWLMSILQSIFGGKK